MSAKNKNQTPLQSAPAKAFSYYTAPMRPEDVETLAKLLVRYYNTITPERCSIYGASMDKAMCRDVYNTLFVFSRQCDELTKIRRNFRDE